MQLQVLLGREIWRTESYPDLHVVRSRFAALNSSPQDPAAPTAHVVTAEYAYDHLAASYDAAYNSPRARAENALMFRGIRYAGCDRGRILDLGCGTGLFLEHAPVAPERYVGVDISGGMPSIARHKFPATRLSS